MNMQFSPEGFSSPELEIGKVMLPTIYSHLLCSRIYAVCLCCLPCVLRTVSGAGFLSSIMWMEN
jgi:hypothetical protein